MSILSRIPRHTAVRLATARLYTTAQARNERLAKYVQVSEEVQAAIARKGPVVALESAIITHGLPSPDNVDLAAEVESVIRAHGAIPATIAVVNGVARIGLERQAIESLGSGLKTTMKVSRRDLPYLTGLGSHSGGTTVAGTMLLANMAGIKVFATGGIGGVHRGVAGTYDISADLTELGRTNVAVVCSGPKPFLDVERTVEFLETEGVPVATFGSREEKQVWLPGFYSRDSLIPSPLVVEDAKEAAMMIYASHALGLKNGQLFCNPIPHEFNIPRLSMHSAITAAVKRAVKRGITGKEITPFILDFIRRETDGASVLANKSLVLNNAKQAAMIAVELSALDNQVGIPVSAIKLSSSSSEATTPEQPAPEPRSPDLVVIGSVAVDIACDATSDVSRHTSNPSRITETSGGVANNVATAAHYTGADVKLVSAIGRDMAGDWVMHKIKAAGLDPRGIQMVDGGSTARYVAVNGKGGELEVASADMKVIEEMGMDWIRPWILQKPEWVCVDGNLEQGTLQDVLKLSKVNGVKVAFEPTSTAKSTRILSSTMPVYPRSPITLTAPNELELASMFHAAKDLGLFETPEWFQIIDALNVNSVFLNQVETMGRAAGVDFSATGILQQAVHLSPYFPNQLIKLGANGVLSVRLIAADTHAPSARNALISQGTGPMKGIWMHHIAGGKAAEVVSVNGVGDTFLGVILGKLSKARGWGGYESSIWDAQKAACLTLASRESVSPELKKQKNKPRAVKARTPSA